MKVKLKVLTGTHTGKEIGLTKPRFLIGRAEDCNLRAGSELISRHHCAILVQGSLVLIEDFGSKNGTLCNGNRVEGTRELKSGDRLKVGPLEFSLHIENVVSTAKRPPVKSVAEAAARAANKPSGTSEDDISQWIGEPTIGKSDIAAAETRSLKFTNTDRIESPKAEESAEPPTEPGKMKRIEPPQPKDSREAAANILKRIAKRR